MKDKLHGLLVVNGFLKTEKFAEHYTWLCRAAQKYGMTLTVTENTRLMYPLAEEGDSLSRTLADSLCDVDFILYWDKDIMLGRLLTMFCEKRNIPIFNTVEAVAVCDDKYETYRRLWAWNQVCREEEKIALLPTVAAPMTYETVGYTKIDFVQGVVSQLGLPLVIKECCGSFGQQVYLARDYEEAAELTKRLAGKPFLYQKYQEASCGRDVRIQVVGNCVVAAMYRFSDTDFRANITNGGSKKEYSPSEAEVSLALRTVKALGLDFAGVDLLFSERGSAEIVCEVNSNAHFKNIYDCTGVNVAEQIMEYIRGKI